MQFEENEHYQLIPKQEHDQAWAVRILEGTYAETVIIYGGISFNEDLEGIAEDECSMSFEFEILESPDTDLTTEDVDFQEYCGKMLTAIIVKAIENDELEMIERESKLGTNDTTEHSD